MLTSTSQPSSAIWGIYGQGIPIWALPTCLTSNPSLSDLGVQVSPFPPPPSCSIWMSIGVKWRSPSTKSLLNGCTTNSPAFPPVPHRPTALSWCRIKPRDNTQGICGNTPDSWIELQVLELPRVLQLWVLQIPPGKHIITSNLG